MIRRFSDFLLPAVCLLFIVLPGRALAMERILDYAVSATLERDASLLITERLVITTENNAALHGISRVFPLVRRREDNGISRYAFDVVSVRMDGLDVPYTRRDSSTMAGIAIGSETYLAAPGMHVCEIVYRSRGHVHFLNDHDELSFSVIGPDNRFPVTRASFTLRLPDGGQILKTSADPDRAGERGTSYCMDGPTTFRTTRPLAPYEEMTVTVAWNKGLVAAPSLSVLDRLGQHRNLLLFGLDGAVLLFLLVIWNGFYRKPPRNIVPLLTPPKGLTPGLAAALHNGGFSSRCFFPDILWLAVHGRLSMDMHDPKRPVLRPLAVSGAADSRLATTTDELQQIIFNGLSSLTLGGRKNKDLYNSFTRFETYYRRNLLKTLRLWRSARLPWLVCLFLGLGGLYAILHVIWHPGYDIDADPATLIGMAVMPCGLLFILMFAIRTLWKQRAYLSVLFALLMTAMPVAFLSLMLDKDIPLIVAFMSVTLLPCAFMLACGSVLTDAGQDLQTKLQGLERYLRMTDKAHLAAINAPGDTPEHYESLLPYAVALNCARDWQSRFEPLLNSLDQAPGRLQADQTCWHDARSRRHLYASAMSARKIEAAVNRALRDWMARRPPAGRRVSGVFSRRNSSRWHSDGD